MKNSSLNEATEIIIEALDKSSKIDKIDKAELMINIKLFLKENEYRENVKVLSKRRNKWKKN
jgi:hypothetical protein